MEISMYEPSLEKNWAVGSYENANDAWQNLYYGLNMEGKETSPRGQKVRETLGCNIYITNPTDNIVFNSFRKSSPYYVAQEYFWYLSGDRNVESISKYSKFWNKIANEDGTINSNYGAYIFNKDYYPIDGMSQWEHLIETLRKDRDSRQAILQIPITPFKGTKDVCCTSSLQFLIRNNKLNMITYMRSNDINLGFCNDIPFFTMLQIKLASILEVKIGWYRHVVGSLHVYENNFLENVEEKTGRKFMFEECTYDSGKKFICSDYIENIEHDYRILAERKTDGLIYPIYRYMADNFDNK